MTHLRCQIALALLLSASTLTWAQAPYGPVARGETLWSIAQKIRTPDAMSLFELMAWLHENNPEAFIARDINRLREGALLVLPPEVSAAAPPPAALMPEPSVPPAAAVPEPSTSPAPRFEPSAPPPAVLMPEPSVPPAAAVPEEPSTSPAPRFEPSAPPSAALMPEPSVPPVATVPESEPGAEPDTAPEAVPERDLVVAPSALAAPPEAETMLPTSAQDMDTSATIDPAEPEAEPEIATDAPETAAETAPSDDVTTSDPPVVPEPDTLSEPDPDAPTDPRDDAVPTAAAAVAPAEPARAAALPLGLVVTFAVLALALAGAGVYFWLRRTHAAPPAAAPQPEHSVEELLARAARERASGNFNLARSALRQAIAQQPNNPALRLRLLEVEFAQNDAASFAADAEALRTLLGGREEALWQQVEIMGRTLCPHLPPFRTEEHG